MTHQFLVASYPKDYLWLVYCLASLKKFARGFLPTVVVLPEVERNGAICRVIRSHGAIPEFNLGTGFARAQIAMMMGDQHCPKADYIYLVGSDCLAIREFEHTTYWRDGKPFMPYNTYAHMFKSGNQCVMWQPGTHAALGTPCENEFMRRLPLAYPKALYPLTRELIRQRHGSFERYVTKSVNQVRNFSESNVLGEVAWCHMRDAYTWRCWDDCTPKENMPAEYPNEDLPIRQFWSHGGLDRPDDKRGDGKTPRQVIVETLGVKI